MSKTSGSCCVRVLGVSCSNRVVIDQTLWFQAIKPISEIIDGVMDDFFGRCSPEVIIHLDVAVLMPSVSLCLCSYQLLAWPKLLLYLYLVSSVINRSVMFQPWNANAADGIRALDRQFLSLFASFVIVKASSLFILLVSSWVGMASEASHLIWAWTEASCR